MELLDSLRAKDPLALGRTMTLLESQAHSQARLELLAKIPALGSVKTLSVGFAGPPGVGKSTLVEALGSAFLEAHSHKSLAVLAVDPSSPLHGGSLLGDRVRMPNLSRHPRAFIRSCPGGGAYGGVGYGTGDMVGVLDYAGFDWIFVEAIGGGQGEWDIANLVDLLILLEPPVGGDDIQGMKKGVLERAHLILVNQADGDLVAPARLRKHALEQALHLKLSSSLSPTVRLNSSENPQSIKELLTWIEAFYDKGVSSGQLMANRERGMALRFQQELVHGFLKLLSGPHKPLLDLWKGKVSEGKISLSQGTGGLLQSLFKENTNL